MSQHSSRGPAWERLRKKVLQRDGYICVYCGQPATEVDHLIPKSLPGSPGDVEDNLVSSCKPCNLAKGAKTLTRTTYVNRRWLDKV